VSDLLGLNDDVIDYQYVNQIPHDNVVLITQNFSPSIPVDARIHVINYDLLLNRTKLYYTANLNEGGHRAWYYGKSQNFSKPWVPVEFFKNQISAEQSPDQVCRQHKFLFAGRRTTPSRTAIYWTLKNYQDQGYLFYNNVRCIEEQGLSVDDIPNYRPLPNKYYIDSYVNFCAETNMLNGIWQRTEKTLEPAIRFQMIVPLASVGFVQYLSNTGISIVPDLIHVPWDHIVDNNQRTKAYCANIKSIMNYSIADLSSIYYDNLELLVSNHRAVLDQPYCQGIWQALEYI
jgi:hypothetical protein